MGSSLAKPKDHKQRDPTAEQSDGKKPADNPGERDKPQHSPSSLPHRKSLDAKLGSDDRFSAHSLSDAGPSPRSLTPSNNYLEQNSPFSPKRNRGVSSITPKSFRRLLQSPRLRDHKKGKPHNYSPVSIASADHAAEISSPTHITASSKPEISDRMRLIQERTIAAANAEKLKDDNATPSPKEALAESREKSEVMIDVSTVSEGLPDRAEPCNMDSPLRRKGRAAAAGTPSSSSGESPSSKLPDGEPVTLSEHWIIDHAKITLGKTIGHSSFGMVTEGHFNGTKVAVKTIKRDPKKAMGNDIEAFKKEAELNCQLRHPNIVLFMGICIQPTEVCIVTELMARGNVHNLLVTPIKGRSVKLSWDLRLQWAVDTAQGMAYLHSLEPPMIHRDLKTTNLLVDRGMNVKICDFGLSRFQAKDKIMSAVGTVQFAAPEVLRHERYTEKADLFSYGTVLWELFTRKTIFQGLPQLSVYKAVVDGDMPPVGNGCDPAYAQLVRDCWQLDAAKRPSFREVLDRLGPMCKEPDDVNC